MNLECDTMTEEKKEQNSEEKVEAKQEPEIEPQQPLPTTRDRVLGVLNHLTGLPIRCVNLILIPETGELIINHTQGMPKHEVIGLMEVFRDETKK